LGDTTFFTVASTHFDVVDPDGVLIHLDLIGEGFATWFLDSRFPFPVCCELTYTFIAPEPATFLLLAVGCVIGVGALGYMRRRSSAR